jgi:hypothetical protein
MTADARKEALFHELDRLRSQGKRPEANAVVRLALKAGFTGREALRSSVASIRSALRLLFRATTSLPLFISAASEQSKAKRILEYACTTSLFTTHLPEQGSAQPMHEHFALHDDEDRFGGNETCRAFLDRVLCNVFFSVPDVVAFHVF